MYRNAISGWGHCNDHGYNALRGWWILGMVATVYQSEGGIVTKVNVAYNSLKDDGKVSIDKGIAYTMIERPVRNLIVLFAVEELQFGGWEVFPR